MPQNFPFQITVLFLLLIASFGMYQEIKITQRPEAQSSPSGSLTDLVLTRSEGRVGVGVGGGASVRGGQTTSGGIPQNLGF